MTTKCSICGTENPPGAASCQKCGFSLGLGETAWPEFPTIEVPQPAMPEWPAAPPLTSTPTPEPPPAEPSDDDLARIHLKRGFEAARANLLEQARWEFEQAADLADDEAIVQMAEAQIAELSAGPEPVAPPAAPAPEPEPPTIPAWIEAPRVETPPSAAPATSSPSSTASGCGGAMVIGLLLSVLVGLFTGCSAVVCGGFLATPFAAFLAGWFVARWVARQNYPASLGPPLAAAVIIGLGGMLGQMIGYPAQARSLEVKDYQSVVDMVNCISAVYFIPASALASLLGWRIGKPKR